MKDRMYMVKWNAYRIWGHAQNPGKRNRSGRNSMEGERNKIR